MAARSIEEWIELIKEWRDSGLSIRKFSDARGLTRNTMQKRLWMHWHMVSDEDLEAVISARSRHTSSAERVRIDDVAANGRTWREMLEEWMNSDDTITAYAKRNGIYPATFHKRARRHAKQIGGIEKVEKRIAARAHVSDEVRLSDMPSMDEKSAQLAIKAREYLRRIVRGHDTQAA